jgi:esterase/lipase
MKEYGLTDEQVEREIAKLQESPLVKLAKKDELIRYRRRQYLYKLRGYEKKGKELSKSGITMEILESLDKNCDENEP